MAERVVGCGCGADAATGAAGRETAIADAVVKPVVATGAEPPLPPTVAAGTPVWFRFTRSRRPIFQASGAGPRVSGPAPNSRLLRFIRTLPSKPLLGEAEALVDVVCGHATRRQNVLAARVRTGRRLQVVVQRLEGGLELRVLQEPDEVLGVTLGHLEREARADTADSARIGRRPGAVGRRRRDDRRADADDALVCEHRL